MAWPRKWYLLSVTFLTLSKKKKKISKGLIKLCFDEIVAVVDRKHIFADF